MLVKRGCAAVVVAFFGVCAAYAQSANDFRGPAELPPASFSGQQFVDSRGCLFLRAGLSGRTNWVPRVTRDRQQICGYPPTFSPQRIDVVEDAQPSASPPAAAPAPRVAKAKGAGAVVRPLAQAPVARAKPEVVAAPAPSRAMPAVRVTQDASRGKIGCYRDAPVAERFRLQGGGTIVLCTKGDGDLAAARPPVHLAGPAGVAPSGYIEVPGKKTTSPSVVVATPSQPKPPKGYRAAWTDDRLNPKRGQGTMAGQTAQDQIWTREVPARLLSEATGKETRLANGQQAQVSTKSVPKGSVPHLFVQVGSFAEAQNAAGAASRLAALGLPVARSKTTRGGNALQTVLAGPFASQAEAQKALALSRGAGFRDAFLR